METKIYSENHFIISTGSVCSFNNDSLTIEFGPADSKLLIELIFRDTENKEITQKTSKIGEKLVLEFENFNNSLGIGNTEPMEIGTLNGKILFANFRIYALNNSPTKLIHYTIYQNK